MIKEETIRQRPRRRVGLVLLAMAALLVTSFLLAAKPAHASTTFTVNSTADQADANTKDGLCVALNGSCTLRAAIEQANATPGADVINFNIATGGEVATISPNSRLPVITEPVTIDGYSQPGASPNTLAKGTNAKLLIEVNGANAGTADVGAGLDIEASNVTVKGLVINSFVDKAGVFISPRTAGDVATNIRIEGNFLGTDPSGTIDRGNGATGVSIFSGTGNTVGGSSPDKRNLISGNDAGGVFIESNPSFGASSNNVVEGNLIGTQKDGLTALGNGVLFNGAAGVTVLEVGGTATGNRILSNSISSNADLGIDLLGTHGPDANDGDNPATAQPDPDADTGPNNLQNFPVLTSAKTGRKGTTIKGTLNSTPNATFTLQFFGNLEAEPSGFGEGKTFAGQLTNVQTDSSGNATFIFKTKSKVPKGQLVTATATDQDGNTSEFSAAKKVVRQR